MKIQRISAVNEPPVFLFQAACKAKRWWSQIALVTAWSRGSQQTQADAFSGVRIFDLHKTKPAFIEEEGKAEYDKYGNVLESEPPVYNGWEPYTSFTIQGLWHPSVEEAALLEQRVPQPQPNFSVSNFIADGGDSQWKRINVYGFECSDQIKQRMKAIPMTNRYVKLWEINPKSKSQFHKSWDFSTAVDMTAAWDAGRNIEKQPILKALIRSMRRKR